MNNIYKIIKPFLENGLESFNNKIKILLYKSNDKIFEAIDFENDTIYQEPLFYAYFNSKIEVDKKLDQIIIGYETSKNKNIEVRTDQFGRIYMPNIGWFSTSLANHDLIYSIEANSLFNNSERIDFTFENIEFIDNTKIELLKYQIPLLRQCYFDVDGEQIEVEIENITKKHLNNITNAYNLIKLHIPSQFELIEKYAPKCVIFNVDTYLRNSFATISAQGIGFYNAYQEDYNEVFFVDDIAHQTGHAIFNTLLFEPSEYFKIEKNTVLEKITMPNGDLIENRDLHVIYHALYTYYTSFTCLDACLENNAFTAEQKHEALGRIAFYLKKCYTDLLLIDNPISTYEKSTEYFTEDGLKIYKEIKNKWHEMYNKWYELVKHFNMSNQPYNFTYANFKELNPKI